ncbi:solute carrier family 22 member 20-like [Ascaphus truei]|uniref:solute carrier family 22 member 20-like n=2 Tax=Ascaphus truei TaxID=8439 RepID=UPI003F5A61E4
MGFDDLLLKIGGLGRFQICFASLLLLPMCFLGCHNLLQNFTAIVPLHRCRLPWSDNQTMTYDRGLLLASVPLDGNQKPESCQRYTEAQSGVWSLNSTLYNNTEPCKDGWVYDKSVFSSTIVTEWDLVCDMRAMRQLAQSIYMVGVLAGSLAIGPLSDKFGRRAVMISSNVLMAVSGTCAAFLPGFASYCFFRSLCGMCLSGIALNIASLNLEWTPPNGRTLFAVLFSYSYTCGQMLLAGLAYIIRDWRWLQFAVTVPFFLFLLYLWFIPESARWMIMRGRSREALRNLKRVAALNGMREVAENLTEEVVNSHMKYEKANVKSTYTPLDLFRTPEMRRRTLCFMLVWFALGFAFFGVALDLDNFGVSVFLVQVLFGAMDIPARLITGLSMSYIGRRVTQSVSLILAGLLILTNMFISKDMNTWRIALATVGKGCLAAAFTCVYLYTEELFPTVIRQTGLGFLYMNARIGAMVAPLVLILREFSPFLPPVCFGATAILAGCVTLLLPETHNYPLPESVEDVEARARRKASHGEISKEEVVLIISPQAACTDKVGLQDPPTDL